jgi:hypothetical protein
MSHRNRRILPLLCLSLALCMPLQAQAQGPAANFSGYLSTLWARLSAPLACLWDAATGAETTDGRGACDPNGGIATTDGRGACDPDGRGGCDPDGRGAYDPNGLLFQTDGRGGCDPNGGGCGN